MITISFLDPRHFLKKTAVAFTNLPQEEELYARLSEGLAKAKGDMITVQMGLPNGQLVSLPNVYSVIFSEEKDAGKLVLPP
ncbi:hypothetical protein KAR91_48910 [Candidatus Pacearchaeota archaeon]|nr:hypothetical protein [Candidatus Pacearchaeota archaeon]